MSRATLTDGLRDSLRKRLKSCPTCGRARGDSLRGLAKKIGMSPSTLSRWMNGTGLPDAAAINRVWAFLGLSASEVR